jgi:hypothetical protein
MADNYGKDEEIKNAIEDTEDRTGRPKRRDTCLLAFAGELKNEQHGPVDDTDRAARGEGSLAADAPVLGIFFGGRVICSFSSHCRLFPRRRDHRVLPSDLRTGEAGIRRGVRTSGGETTRSPPPLIPGTAGDITLATGDGEEPERPNAGFGAAKIANSPPSLPVDPVRAGIGEAKDAMLPVALAPPWPGDNDGREDKTPNPPLAVEPMGVSGRSSEANSAEALLRLDPVGANGCSGEARNVKLRLLPLEGDSADEKTLAVRPALAGGESAGAGKGGSSTSIFLRGEKAGKRQRRLWPAAQGSEKTTGDWSASMRSSARWWCRCGVWKARATSMAAARAVLGFLGLLGSCADC